MTFKRAWYIITHWEKWHYNIKYVLLSPAWLWYSLKAGSFYFFTPANPTLTFGGFEGGPKKEIYDLLPAGTYPKSIYIDPTWPIDKVEALMLQAGLTYPIAVKPNIGMMGFLFRKLDSVTELTVYHQTITVEYILQELIEYPIEVSVFYYRMPEQSKGNITGFVRKEALEVVGDGFTTLEVLMEQLTNRPGFYIDEWKTKHQQHLKKILPAGSLYRLSWVANLSRGGRLVNLENQKDEALLMVFDSISHASQHLYYGRYDIKCASIEALKKGQQFSILEFNGTGAEPHHVYGNGYSLYKALQIIVSHWRALYTIARYHNQKGIPYKSLKQGIAFTKRSNKYFKHLRKLDRQMPVFH